ncbi:hypothetical protein B0H17DRAFT_1213631 [Mycena rosella]|uniref:Uncharacterized protein n=1 Tax=Mycena rosella TaxID=1033263 RepID=A0AAD7G1S0_MYCRO|nr:hypothetical protein B0H17DRAFT_1213631 [Mycena rosella]
MPGSFSSVPSLPSQSQTSHHARVGGAQVSHPIKLLNPTRPTIDYSPSRIAPARVAAYSEWHNRSIHRARLTPAAVPPAINASPHQLLRAPPPPTFYLAFGASANDTARNSSCCRADGVHIRLVSYFSQRSSSFGVSL